MRLSQFSFTFVLASARDAIPFFRSILANGPSGILDGQLMATLASILPREDHARRITANDVLFIRDRLKVLRVDTGRVSTKVVDYKSIGDGATRELIRQSMSKSSLPKPIGPTETSISLFIPITLPLPAGICSPRSIYKRPELVNIRLEDRPGHSVPVASDVGNMFPFNTAKLGVTDAGERCCLSASTHAQPRRVWSRDVGQFSFSLLGAFAKVTGATTLSASSDKHSAIDTISGTLLRHSDRLLDRRFGVPCRRVFAALLRLFACLNYTRRARYYSVFGMTPLLVMGVMAIAAGFGERKAE